MSYIRTISGIYEYDKHISIEGDILYEIVFDDPYTDYGVNGKYSRGKILNQADTIWELCDGFYIDDGSGDFKKENIFETILEFENVYHKKRISDTYAIGYGFIKTDKGLIFVSEFKDKDMVLI